jgi:hypothetical protein
MNLRECPHFSTGYEYTRAGQKAGKSIPICRLAHEYCGKVSGYSAYGCPLEADA